jgi:hypothetical protein
MPSDSGPNAKPIFMTRVDLHAEHLRAVSPQAPERVPDNLISMEKTHKQVRAGVESKSFLLCSAFDFATSNLVIARDRLLSRPVRSG